MELFLSLTYSLNKNHLGVHYLPGTGLGVEVRERKTGGRKPALMELKESKAEDKHLKNHYK